MYLHNSFNTEARNLSDWQPTHQWKVFPYQTCWYGPYMVQVLRWYSITFEHSMEHTWIWYGFHIKPCMALSSFSYNSIVLYYGNATYLAEIHRYPIGSSMGVIWLTCIPLPHDLWPLTIGILCIWQSSIQLPYHLGTMVFDMGMLRGFGKVLHSSRIIQACLL